MSSLANVLTRKISLQHDIKCQGTLQILAVNMTEFITEPAARSCSSKKLLFKILQNSKENTYTGVSVSNFNKKRLQQRFLTVNLAKFLTTTFVSNSTCDFSRKNFSEGVPGGFLEIFPKSCKKHP